ncbi:MAG: ABC transporter substrate-binding protein [Rhodospirillaceae bacterium]|nr:ABC transporter substrate-binding protein [Rhodospirillaceae bacterium]
MRHEAKTTLSARRAACLAAGLAAALVLAGPSRAEQIVVSNYGVAANGMPYAVALEKGFFKQEGADVTGILSSAGGGTTLRNMLAGDAPYAEVNPNAAIAAILQGADIKIVSDNVLTVAEFVWAVEPDSPIQSVRDLKGRKIGYTNPRSTSQGLASLVLKAGGLTTEDAELVKTGGFGEGIAALDTGLIDVAPIPEPLWSKFKDKYRPVAKATDILPPIANVLGAVSTAQAGAKADFIRAVIRARRRAVAFMQEHPDEAGDIVARVYNLEPTVARSAVRNLVESRTDGIEYWGSGQFHMDGLQRAIELQKAIGALSGDIDVREMIDTQYLPEDIRALK